MAINHTPVVISAGVVPSNTGLPTDFSFVVSYTLDPFGRLMWRNIPPDHREKTIIFLDVEPVYDAPCFCFCYSSDTIYPFNCVHTHECDICQKRDISSYVPKNPIFFLLFCYVLPVRSGLVVIRMQQRKV